MGSMRTFNLDSCPIRGNYAGRAGYQQALGLPDWLVYDFISQADK